MNIDWSKAPGWATHYGAETDLYVEAWYLVEGDQIVKYSHDDLVQTNVHGNGSEFFPGIMSLIARPKPWNGEGLPPIGTVCEFAGFNPEETTFDDPSVGDKVTVIAHYLSGCIEVAAFTYNCAANFGSLQVAQGAHGCFRPIRTAEQVAADKRLHEIRNALTAIKAGQSSFPNDIVRGNITIAVVEAMIDAGYRKQVQP